jgi:hypothetical protein
MGKLLPVFWHVIVRYTRTIILAKYAISIFNLLLWRENKNVTPQQSYLSIWPHGVTSQNMVTFVVTAAKPQMSQLWKYLRVMPTLLCPYFVCSYVGMHASTDLWIDCCRSTCICYNGDSSGHAEKSWIAGSFAGSYATTNDRDAVKSVPWF